MNKKCTSSIHLDVESIELIKSTIEKKYYSENHLLYYKGHIPLVAFLVSEGQVHLTSQKKIKHIAKSGQLIGLHEFFYHSPSLLDAHATRGTVLYFLDKSSLNELMKTNPSKLSSALKELVK